MMLIYTTYASQYSTNLVNYIEKVKLKSYIEKVKLKWILKKTIWNRKFILSLPVWSIVFGTYGNIR